MKLITLIRNNSPIPVNPLRGITYGGNNDFMCKFCSYTAPYELGVRNHRRKDHAEQTNESDWETDSEIIECNIFDEELDTAGDLKHNFISTKWMCMCHSQCLVSRNDICRNEDCFDIIVEK